MQRQARFQLYGRGFQILFLGIKPEADNMITPHIYNSEVSPTSVQNQNQIVIIQRRPLEVWKILAAME